ncbi:MAG: Holliday junction resolvase RuvX [Bacillota bacterium]
MGSRRAKTIGIDLGEKRVGLAISDEMGLYAHPLGVLDFRGEEELAEELAGIAEERGVASFVVGLPRNMNGTIGESAKKSQRFANQLQRKSGLPVTMLDERLTTSQAEKEMIGLGKSRRWRRKTIDSVAAVLILETYLRQTGEHTNQC